MLNPRTPYLYLATQHAEMIGKLLALRPNPKCVDEDSPDELRDALEYAKDLARIVFPLFDAIARECLVDGSDTSECLTDMLKDELFANIEARAGRVAEQAEDDRQWEARKPRIVIDQTDARLRDPNEFLQGLRDAVAAFKRAV